MLNVILALSCAVILAECSLLKKEDLSTLAKRSEQCSELNQCAFPLSKVDSDELSQLSDAETYELFCTQRTEFEECYENGKSQCNKAVVLNLMEGKVSVAEYICSPEGEKDLVALLEFPCVSNVTKRLETQKLIAKCVQKFQLDLQISALDTMINGASEEAIDICSHVDVLDRCIIDGATNKCGAEVGAFVKRVWETASKPSFEKFQCNAKDNEPPRVK